MMDIDGINDIPEVIVSACIFHNIFINEDDIDGFLDGSNDNNDDANYDDIFSPGVAREGGL